jgi:competence protein ComEC
VYEPNLPRRPTLPVSFYALVALLVSEQAAKQLIPFEMSGESASRLSLVSLVAALLCAGLAVRFMRREAAKSERRSAAASLPVMGLLLLFAFCLGLLIVSIFLMQGASFTQALKRTPISRWRLSVIEDSSKTRYGFRCKARATSEAGIEGDIWLSLGQELRYGQVLSVVGRFEQNSNDEWGRTSRAQGVWGTVQAVHILSQERANTPLSFAIDLRDEALMAIEPQASSARALLAGCVCGYRSSMKELGLETMFSSCGVAHLIAVSGSHIAVVASIVQGCTQRLRLRRGLRLAIVLGCAGMFVLCCGLPLSAVRSWMMACAAATSELIGRRSYALSSVCLVALVMALFDPGAPSQLGFSLSVASVIGLCLLSPYLSYVLQVLFSHHHRMTGRRLPRHIASLHKELRSALAAALVAQLITLPLVIPTFGKLSIVAPLANVLLALPFTALIGVGSVAVIAVCLMPQADILLIGCDAVASAILLIVRGLMRLPLVSIAVQASSSFLWVATTLALAAMVIWWPRVDRRALLTSASVVCAVLLALFVRWRWFAPARIVVLDVGQGDAVLVQDGPSAILVDTGPQGAIVEALGREHVYHLDAVVLTHLHDDHVGGVGELVGTLPCGRVLVAEGVTGCLPSSLSQAIIQLTFADAEELSYKDKLHVGRFSLEVVWPRTPVTGEDNADSVELNARFEGGDGSTLDALLTGDAERDQTAQVLRARDVGDVDFLKVGHHGSSVSVGAEEAAALDPEVSVASAGKDNAYGHPTAECTQILQGVGSSFFCTIDHGDISVELSSEGPRISFQR